MRRLFSLQLAPDRGMEPLDVFGTFNQLKVRVSRRLLLQQLSQLGIFLSQESELSSLINRSVVCIYGEAAICGLSPRTTSRTRLYPVTLSTRKIELAIDISGENKCVSITLIFRKRHWLQLVLGRIVFLTCIPHLGGILLSRYRPSCNVTSII